MNKVVSKATLLIFSLWMLAACSQHHALQKPSNESEKFYGTEYEDGEYVSHLDTQKTVYASNLNCESVGGFSKAVHYRADQALTPNDRSQAGRPPFHVFNKDLPLSPGDMVQVAIENGEGFNGQYIVNPDGSLQIPLVVPVKAAGLGLSQVADNIEIALVRAEIFRPSAAKVSVRVMHWAPVNVTVTGAVFQPGRVRINENRQESVVSERVSATGDYAVRRSIVEAIRNASGVRPDAKLDQVILVRGGWQVELDLSGVVNGLPISDVALVDGDQVIVPTTGCFQSSLVRPSQLTPRGFRVFMSNLTSPVLGNAAAAVGSSSSSLPYGTTLLQAAVSANCVGGAHFTNAPRRVVLASKNPLTQEFQVIERSIEELMRGAQREHINPYLMPNDSLACYDSNVTNLREVARSLGEIVAPMRLLF